MSVIFLSLPNRILTEWQSGFNPVWRPASDSVSEVHQAIGTDVAQGRLAKARLQIPLAIFVCQTRKVDVEVGDGLENSSTYSMIAMARLSKIYSTVVVGLGCP